MIRIDAAPADEQVETIDLFAIGDQVYSVPKRYPAGVGLRYLREVRQQGLLVAGAGLLERVIGATAYAALAEAPGFRMEHLDELMEQVSKLVLGAPEPDDDGGQDQADEPAPSSGRAEGNGRRRTSAASRSSGG